MSNKEKKYVGEIIWFCPKKGFGFISWLNDQEIKQKDLFVHFSDIDCEGFKTLYKQQKVSFGVGVNIRGEPKAIEVTVLKN